LTQNDVETLCARIYTFKKSANLRTTFGEISGSPGHYYEETVFWYETPVSLALNFALS
jgi:hypothetical protein